MTKEIVDSAEIAARADQIAKKIPRAAVAASFRRRAIEFLRNDERNLRPATAGEIADAPDWAQKKARRGETIYVFAPCRSSLAHARKVARQLCDACAEYDHLANMPADLLVDRDRSMRALMGDFIAKIDRGDFTTMEVKSRIFAREHKMRIETVRASERVCGDEEVFAGPGLVWGRVASVAEMWMVGKEFRNCLARHSGHSASYANDLRAGLAQFWVLRDHDGKGLIVVMAYPDETRIADVKGPRNAPIDPLDASVATLASELGWRTGAAAPSALAEEVRLLSRLLRDDAPAEPIARRVRPANQN